VLGRQWVHDDIDAGHAPSDARQAATSIRTLNQRCHIDTVLSPTEKGNGDRTSPLPFLRSNNPFLELRLHLCDEDTARGVATDKACSHTARHCGQIGANERWQ